jgi:DNA-binding transcriptional ArsR family regulator
MRPVMSMTASRQRMERARSRRRPEADHEALPAQSDFDLDMMSAAARQASAFLKALSHDGRLMILCLLAEGEKSVSEIEAKLGLRQPAVSQQLARLRADDMVEARRDGKSIYYSLARNEVREVIELLHRAFCKPKHGR